MKIDDFVNIKNKLNPKLWDDLELNEKVKESLVKISDAFLEFAQIKKSIVDDIWLVGSNANYNWHDKSDIDLHILINYKECTDCSIFKVKECVDFIKNNFNENHDIHIHGIPVEIYIQEPDEQLDSSAIYSIQKNKWIKKPSRFEKINTDIEEIKNKYLTIKKKIDQLSDYEKVDELFKKIIKDRKNGLKSKKGELDENNLLFKMLRSNGLLAKIKEKRNQLLSDKLSLGVK